VPSGSFGHVLDQNRAAGTASAVAAGYLRRQRPGDWRTALAGNGGVPSPAGRKSPGCLASGVRPRRPRSCFDSWAQVAQRRGERPRRDLLLRKSLRSSGGRVEGRRRCDLRSGAIASDATLRPYYLASIATSAESNNAANSGDSTLGAACLTHDPDSEGGSVWTGEPGVWAPRGREGSPGSRSSDSRGKSRTENGLTTCPERALDVRAKAA